MTDPNIVVEKYLLHRATAHTRAHQEDLQAYYQAQGRGLPIEEAEARYFEAFRARSAAEVRRFEEERAEIQGAPMMSLAEKRKAIDKLTPPKQPAWGPTREDAFIKAYGDPRANIGLLYTMLHDWQQPRKQQRRPTDGSTFYEERTPWELHTARQLLNPMDGSVPVFMLNAAGQPVVPELTFGTPVGDYQGINRSYYDPLVGRESLTGGSSPSPFPSAPSAPPPPLPPAPLPPQPRIIVPGEYDGLPPAAEVVPAPPPPAPAIELATDRRQRAVQERILREAERAAANVCPHCYQSKPRGFTQHVEACARRRAVSLATS